MSEVNPKYFKTRNSFRRWLSVNHDKKQELWLLFYKKHTGKPSIMYDEAVEEALCFGWIDGILKRIDDEKYKQRFSPRKSDSIWSKLNKQRSLNMIEQGKMTNAGLLKIDEAKKHGWWDKAYSLKQSHKLLPEFNKVLSLDPEAQKNFNSFSKSQRNQYAFWINLAKKKETKLKRIAIAIERLKQNKKPGWFD